ncbi:hypothetical protein [Nonomuraea aridisoli]|uniref:Uncharacterized protein n=1 Tax=Nonomuraea aridisoli TaxID=2070368 RepID=A0A2W2FHQ4_9ACTN|nr:hypothetical protein [Nonomuraea aridisoli]PZG21227.1 hypothetical protein C1J01_07150 [Nonomuraea aridisoli]
MLVRLGLVRVIDLPFLGLRYPAAEGAGAQANDTIIQASDARELDSAIVAIGDNVVERNRPRLALTQEPSGRVDGRIDANVMFSNNP